MLNAHPAVAAVAVKDLAAAKPFYVETLGLEVTEANDDFFRVKAAGSSQLVVYRSEFGGSNPATSVIWPAGAALESLVRSLTERGVRFEHYDFPGANRQGDLHQLGAQRAAWFKDPEGNIHCLLDA